MSSTLSTGLTSFFLDHGKLLLYKKGEVILHPYPSTSEIFFLRKGFVKQYSLFYTGNMLVTDLFNPGSFFPAICIITNLPNHYYFEAMTTVNLYKVRKEEIKSYLDNHPNLASLITNQTLSSYLELIKRTEPLIFYSAKLRLVSFLLYLGKVFGNKQGKKITINLPLSHRDISLCVGNTRETTTLEMIKLKKLELISYAEDAITIRDLKKLEEIMTN